MTRMNYQDVHEKRDVRICYYYRIYLGVRLGGGEQRLIFIRFRYWILHLVFGRDMY